MSKKFLVFIGGMLLIFFLNFYMYEGDQVEKRDLPDDYHVIQPAEKNQQWEFEEDNNLELMDNFYYNGESIETDKFLEKTNTEGVLILKDGTTLYENYYNDTHEGSLFPSASTNDSILALLLGIAHNEGKLEDVDDKLTDYIPELKNTPYKKSTVRQALESSTGVHWDVSFLENPDEIWRKEENVFDYFLKQRIERIREPSTKSCHFENSGLILGFLLQEITEDNFSHFVEEYLWKSMGVEHRSKWPLEASGKEVPFNAFKASLRDYGRIGKLVLEGGQVEDNKILSEDWIERMTTHNNLPMSEASRSRFVEEKYWSEVKLGERWFIPRDQQNDEFLAAIGSGGQYIYINPENNFVGVKMGSNEEYAKIDNYRKNINFFRSLVEKSKTVAD